MRGAAAANELGVFLRGWFGAVAPGEEGRLCRWRRRRPERFFFFFFMIVAVERISAAVLISTLAVAETTAGSTPVRAESKPGLVTSAVLVYVSV